MTALFVKLRHPDAVAPRRVNGSPGYDLFSCESAVIPAGEYRSVCTGISVSFSAGTYMRIVPGWAATLGIGVLSGVIDSDFRGSINVVLINHGKEDFAVSAGDKVAQAVFEKISTPEVFVVDDLA